MAGAAGQVQEERNAFLSHLHMYALLIRPAHAQQKSGDNCQ